MAWVTIQEAAALLDVSQDTIRRRIRREELVSRQEATPQGYRWLVEVEEVTEDISDAPSDAEAEPRPSHGQDIGGAQAAGEVQTLHALVDALQSQIAAQGDELAAKNQQIEQLHVLLRQAQTVALPAPQDSRPWWRRLWPGA